MRIIGLTGGIACGKSTVSAELRKCGAAIIDADALAHELSQPHQPLFHAYVQRFGREIVTADGTLDRARMAALIFADADLLARVNAIIHPAVGDDFDAWRKRLTVPLCAMESAILFESGFDRRADVRLTVYAPEAIRLQRVMARDGAAEADVRRRMQSQWTDERKAALSDAVITNDGLSALIPQVEAFLNRWL